MGNTIPQDVPQKQCKVCLKVFPDTEEYFYKRPSNKNGLDTYCKKCRYIYIQAQKKKPKAEKPIIPDNHKQCDDCLEIFPATLEHFHAYKRAPSGLRNVCRACRSKREKSYRQERPNHYQTYESNYRAKHREQRRKISHRYEQKTRGKRKAYYQEYNPRYRKTHPGYIQACHANRKARKLGGGGTHTAQDIQQQYARQKGKCYYCKKHLTKYHVDHIVPLSRGGSNNPSNLVIACPPCNLSKHNKLLHEWAEGGRLM